MPMEVLAFPQSQLHSLHMAWLESGGIFALANIRGGGEYGNQWHEGGKEVRSKIVLMILSEPLNG